MTNCDKTIDKWYLLYRYVWFMLKYIPSNWVEPEFFRVTYPRPRTQLKYQVLAQYRYRKLAVRALIMNGKAGACRNWKRKCISFQLIRTCITLQYLIYSSVKDLVHVLISYRFMFPIYFPLFFLNVDNI